MDVRRFRRLALGLALVALLALAAALSAYAASGKSSAKTTIKIGFMHALSGSGAGYAPDAISGVKLAVEQINRDHSSRVQFDYVEGDDATDPTTASQTCSRLASQGVDVIVGSEFSAAALACQQAIVGSNIPYIAVVNGAKLGCQPNLFVVGPSPQQASLYLVNYLLHAGKNKIYFVGTNSSAPRNQAQIIQQDVQAEGGTFAGSSFEPLGQTDQSAILASIKSSGANAVVTGIVDSAANIGLHKQIAADPQLSSVKQADVVMTPIVAQSLGSDAVGLIGTGSYYASLNNAVNKVFLPAFRKLTKPDAFPSANAAGAWSSVMMIANIADALANKKQTISGSALIAGLKTANIQSPGGLIQISNHYSRLTMYVGQYGQGGNVKLLYASKPRRVPAVGTCP